MLLALTKFGMIIFATKASMATTTKAVSTREYENFIGFTNGSSG